jgi:choline dehydrogenase
MMSHPFFLLICFLFFVSATIRGDETYDYIIVGSGPGGGPLAANLAKEGYSVLLIEAGDDQGANLNEQIPAFNFLSSTDPKMRWDFFVTHYTDNEQALKDTKMAWRTSNGSYYVGLDPPSGSEQLGIYYPRAGTVGGCSTHNAMAAVLPTDGDWEYIAKLTGDSSWRYGTRISSRAW